jgi:c-di-GMP-binding flagellar brake protein YcgR
MTGRRRTDKRMTTHPPVQATDRRAAQRVPVQIMVRFSATDSFQHIGDGTALDLSESGCKLCSAHVLPIGSFWDLYLTIPETSRPVLISEVRVVWATEHEYGIEFLRVTARERTRLRHFLWKHMNRSTLRGGPPLFTLVDHSSPRRPHLKSLP